MELEQIKVRFLREEPSMRLGHLASDLLRIAGFMKRGMINEAKPVIRESMLFAEWASPAVEPRVQGILSEIQSFFALKELQLSRKENFSEELDEITSTSTMWSEKLLKEAGLA